MKGRHMRIFYTFLMIFMFSSTAQSFDRIEQKCLDAGYTIVAENCGENSAPEDVCPYHEKYFKSCSKSAWCLNEGYTYKSEDCKLPSFVSDICPNNFPLYKNCMEDITKACTDAGYKSAKYCKLSEARCPYSDDFGHCCTDCAEYPIALDELPRGYVQDGDACYTCSGKIRIRIKPAPCEGFVECPLGPDGEDTPSCLSGDRMLYKSCQNAEIKCHASGYTQTSCLDSEDVSFCPDDNSYMSCKLNCDKLAKLTYPKTNFITEDITNPELNSDYMNMKSYLVLENEECRPQKRPVVTLNITPENIDKYKNIFNMNISDIDFRINMQSPSDMEFNGNLQNSIVIFSGAQPSCLFSGGLANLSGDVQIKGANKVCNSFSLSKNSKFHLASNLNGDIKADDGAEIIVTRNLNGLVKVGNNVSITIKGKLIAEDLLNSTLDNGSIVLGCNSKAQIKRGMELNTANLIVKNNSLIETPQIILISKSDMLSLANSLSTIHLYSQAKIIHNLDENNQLEIASNTSDENCQDKYLVYLGSSFDETRQSFSLQADDTKDKDWQCKQLAEEQNSCK